MTAELPPPDREQALVTAGVLCHFIAADPAMTEAFRAWAEHHPGDLTCEEVVEHLGLVHDLLAPDCGTPATADFTGGRRDRPGYRQAVTDSGLADLLALIPDDARQIAPLPGTAGVAVFTAAGQAAAWVRANADAIHQALFDAEVYRTEHDLPREGERRDFSRLAAEVAAMTGLDRDEPRR